MVTIQCQAYDTIMLLYPQRKQAKYTKLNHWAYIPLPHAMKT